MIGLTAVYDLYLEFLLINVPVFITQDLNFVLRMLLLYSLMDIQILFNFKLQKRLLSGERMSTNSVQPTLFSGPSAFPGMEKHSL